MNTIARARIDLAQALRHYGVRCSREEVSGLSESRYFVASKGGRKCNVRVSDHDLPSLYAYTGGADGKTRRVDVRPDHIDWAVPAILAELGMAAEAEIERAYDAAREENSRWNFERSPAAVAWRETRAKIEEWLDAHRDGWRALTGRRRKRALEAGRKAVSHAA
jgi:hypothetical protein